MKKSKKSGGKQGKVVLKKWSKEELVRGDWDFTAASLIAKGAASLFHVYMWELDRELGSGTGPCALSPVGSKFLPRFSTNPGMSEVSRSEIERLTKLIEGPVPTDQRLHTFLIDLSRTESEIVEAFRAWLKDDIRHPGRKCPAYKPGRTFEPSAALGRLAAYRLSMAGYTRKEALKILGKSEISAQNWAAAKRFIKRAVHEKLKAMRSAVGTNGWNDWRELFCVRTWGCKVIGSIKKQGVK